MTEKIRLGVSACLLGEEVRYNGGHARDRFITDTLSRYVEFVPVCPEVEMGLSTPRESMRLVGDPENPRLMTGKTGIDHTERMQRWAAMRVRELEAENLCGFIFKSKSPSSGLHRVKVYTEKGHPATPGVGMFARAFTEHFPLLPVEEEGRLYDQGLRENFIEQIFTLKRWREALAEGKTRSVLVDFHSRHKLLILSHSQELYRKMGKLVAKAAEYEETELFQMYEEVLLKALKLRTTTAKNINVLQHMLGYFKKDLSGDEKAEILELFDHYRRGTVPLIVPVTLINHFVRKYDQPYLKQQYYLEPHPLELKLRL